MPNEFEPDHMEDLIVCGFGMEIIAQNERMVKRVNDRVFSAVPWESRGFTGTERTPTIWLVELKYRYSAYVYNEAEINAFVSEHS